MRASAHVTVARTQGSAGTRITRLHSEPPLVLRPINAIGAEPYLRWKLGRTQAAQLSLSAGAAGPVGGDHLRLNIDVEAGAALVLRSVSATLALPGPYDLPSRTEITVRVAANGCLVWLPGPLIAAQGCRHHEFVQVFLERQARLLLREELLLGRCAEQSGAIRRRLRVCLDDQPLLDQELAVGPGAAGWNGPAIAGGHKALGSLLIVDPAWEPGPVEPQCSVPAANTAVLPLSGPAVLVTALAADSLALRRQLEIGIAAIDANLTA